MPVRTSVALALPLLGLVTTGRTLCARWGSRISGHLANRTDEAFDGSRTILEKPARAIIAKRCSSLVDDFSGLAKVALALSKDGGVPSRQALDAAGGASIGLVLTRLAILARVRVCRPVADLAGRANRTSGRSRRFRSGADLARTARRRSLLILVISSIAKMAPSALRRRVVTSSFALDAYTPSFSARVLSRSTDTTYNGARFLCVAAQRTGQASCHPGLVGEKPRLATGTDGAALCACGASDTTGQTIGLACLFLGFASRASRALCTASCVRETTCFAGTANATTGTSRGVSFLARGADLASKSIGVFAGRTLLANRLAGPGGKPSRGALLANRLSGGIRKLTDRTVDALALSGGGLELTIGAVHTVGETRGIRVRTSGAGAASNGARGGRRPAGITGLTDRAFNHIAVATPSASVTDRLAVHRAGGTRFARGAPRRAWVLRVRAGVTQETLYCARRR